MDNLNISRIPLDLIRGLFADYKVKDVTTQNILINKSINRLDDNSEGSVDLLEYRLILEETILEHHKNSS